MNNLKLKIMDTNRLVLRPFEMKDASDIFNIFSNPIANEYVMDSLSTDIAQIERMIKNSPNTSGYSFSIILKETQQLIGTCGMSEYNGDWEFGYCIDPMYWRNGYATETLNALIDFAKSIDVKRLVGEVAIDNIASVKVMEKCGMRFDYMSEFTKKDGSKTFQSSYYSIQL